MRKKDKKLLRRIILTAILLAGAWSAEHFSLLPTLLTVGEFDLQALLLFLIPYAVIGYDILWRALRNVLQGQIFDENLLMSIATVGAFVTGEYAEAVFVMLFYSVGVLFEHIAVGKSRRSIKALLSIRADTAFLEDPNGELVEKPCEEICVGEIICVKAGGKIPLDGEIVEGNTSLNTVALTGESLPRDVGVGDTVLSGCVNLSGFIKLKVTKPFEESTVSRILSLVEDSASNKAKSEEFISKFARIYTPIVVISATLLATVPPLFLGISDFAVWKDWIYRAMTFLVISCPCALVISVPLSYFGGIGSASTRGILIKGSNYLDALSKCDTVVFDKTGTLTEGVFEVSDISPALDTDAKHLLFLAATAEKHSTHPIAQSLLRAYETEENAPTGDLTSVEEIPGLGIKALLEQKILLAGNEKMLRDHNVPFPEEKNEQIGAFVLIAYDGKYMGRITVSDRIQSGAKDALDGIRKAGVKRTVMLTGDRTAQARATADALGITEYLAELLPADKVRALEEIMAENAQTASKGSRGVAFVGDGINDAPVLARADVGIAMGALGSDAAIEAADVVLMADDLKKIEEAILLSRRTRRIVIQNIIFALGVKFLVLILGACGIVGLNAAVFADVGVAVIAILNAMRNLRSQKRR